tara:strand:+ start:2492 stop:3883 length:1392 start_codon:yes stop_codon:yes gene_type:complete
MSGLNFAGEFSLKEMKLLTSAGAVIDIKKMTQSIEIFESLTSPSLTGNITLLDIDNVMENAPILGQEYMSLKIETPTLEEEAFDFSENVFAVYKIVNKENAANETQIFTLSFCSPELLRSNRTKVSKSYTDTIDKTIENILRDSRYINTKKKLFLETTSGIRKVVAPNVRPFAFIDNLKDEALSVKTNSPDFFFFETTKGIHFRSLGSMYSAGTRGNYNTGDIQSFEPGQKSPNPESEYGRVLEFQINSNNDMLLNIRGGLLGSNVIEYNMYNKKFNTQRFKYFDDFDIMPRIDENPIYNNTKIDGDDNTIGDFTNARTHLHSIYSNGGTFGQDTQYDNEDNLYPYRESGIADAILFKQSKNLELKFGVNISMKITGSTTLAVGDMIELQIPVTGRVHDKENDEYMTGKYLITELRHMFSTVDKKHEIALVASKDSLPKEYPKISDSREPTGTLKNSVEVTYT